MVLKKIHPLFLLLTRPPPPPPIRLLSALPSPSGCACRLFCLMSGPLGMPFLRMAVMDPRSGLGLPAEYSACPLLFSALQ